MLSLHERFHRLYLSIYLSRYANYTTDLGVTPDLTDTYIYFQNHMVSQETVEICQPLLVSESRRIDLVDSRIKDRIDGEQLETVVAFVRMRKKAWLGHQSRKS
ncbi:hypothetical protein Bca4012_066759 [Brassica carinata]